MTRKQAEKLGYCMHSLGVQTIMVSPTGREQAYRSQREALQALERAIAQAKHAADGK